MGRTIGISLVGLGVLVLLACGGGGGGDPVDTRVPTLASSVPAHTETGVSPETVIDLFWAQDLDPSTVSTTHVSLQGGSGPMSGTVSYDAAARRIRLVPDENLALGAQYTAHVSQGLATSDGRVLAAPYDVRFRIRQGTYLPAQLLETEAVDRASLRVLALNDRGRGFVVWLQEPAAGNRTLWATAFDAATGPGVARSLATNLSVEIEDAGVAVNEAGDAIVAWGTQGATKDAWAVLYDAGTDNWGSPQQLNVTLGEDARSPRVGLDAQGRAFVVWAQAAGFGLPEDLWSRYYTTAGWGAAQLLESSPGAARGVSIDMLPSGQACVAWHQAMPTVFDIFARRLHPVGGLSAVEPLEADGATRAFSPQVAMAPDGSTLVCWHQERGAVHSDERMWANHFVAGFGWEGEQVLQDDTGENRGFRLEKDAHGNAVLVWHQYVNPYHYAYARRHRADGTWDDVFTLSGANAFTIHANTLDLAVNPEGRALAAWVQSGAGDEIDLLVRAYAPESGWASLESLATPPFASFPAPGVALGGAGAAIVAWSQGVFDTLGAYLRADAWSDVRQPGLGWQGASLLEDNEVGTAYQPAAHVDRFGRGVVVWAEQRGTGPETDIFYRVYR